MAAVISNPSNLLLGLHLMCCGLLQAAGIFHAAARAVDVVILCVLWRATGNLAAPMVAALLAQTSDIAAVYQRTQHDAAAQLRK